MKFYQPAYAENLKPGMRIHNGDNQMLVVNAISKVVPGTVNVYFKNMVGMHVYHNGDVVYVDLK